MVVKVGTVASIRIIGTVTDQVHHKNFIDVIAVIIAVTVVAVVVLGRGSIGD
jgi:hypothetical protein